MTDPIPALALWGKLEGGKEVQEVNCPLGGGQLTWQMLEYLLKLLIFGAGTPKPSTALVLRRLSAWVGTKAGSPLGDTGRQLVNQKPSSEPLEGLIPPRETQAPWEPKNHAPTEGPRQGPRGPPG